jgi:hypothetical protein
MFRTIASILIAFAVLVAPVSGLQLPETVHATYAEAQSPLLVTADLVTQAPVKAKASTAKEQTKKKHHAATRHHHKSHASHHHKSHAAHHHHSHAPHHHKISHAHSPLGLTGPPVAG